MSYEVFAIPSTDYHNELYGILHERFQNEDTSAETRERIKLGLQGVSPVKYRLRNTA